MKKAYGFPSMDKEINEKRAFLPDFFGKMKDFDIDIYLEDGYGSKMGYTSEDYLKENDKIIFSTKENVYSKDVVTVLRAPNDEEYMMMKKGSVLISMLHYQTRELRNNFMEKLGLITFSMDSMVDDDHRRVVVNNYKTSYNGAKIAIEELEKAVDTQSLNRPVNVAIIGMGEIGLTVAKAFKNLSNDRLKKHGDDYKGLKVTMLTRSITSNEKLLTDEISKSDILVDASSRHDTSIHIVTNDLIGKTPKHTVLLDITADPYDFEKNPPQLKAIEGIPTGTLDHIVFSTNDPIYDSLNDQLEKKMNLVNRRIVVSCNAWPGVDPVASKEIYGRQMLPIIKVLVEHGEDNLSIDSRDYYERILVRSSYKYFLEENM